MGKKQKGGYGVVYQEVTRNRNLSLSAKGLYAYLASLSGYSGECFPSLKIIMEDNGISEGTAYKCINSLVEAGVVEKEQVRGEGGKFGHTVYKVSHKVNVSEKTGSPFPKKPDTATPGTAAPGTVFEGTKNNKNLKITDSKNNNKNNTLSAADDLFDELWELYPKKRGKSKVSEKSKKQIFEIGPEKMIRTIDRYKEEIKINGTSEQFIMYGSTFFNGSYTDYLGENYTPPEKPKEKNDFLNHEQSTTDYAAVEKLLE